MQTQTVNNHGWNSANTEIVWKETLRNINLRREEILIIDFSLKNRMLLRHVKRIELFFCFQSRFRELTVNYENISRKPTIYFPPSLNIMVYFLFSVAHILLERHKLKPDYNPNEQNGEWKPSGLFIRFVNQFATGLRRESNDLTTIRCSNLTM